MFTTFRESGKQPTYGRMTQFKTGAMMGAYVGTKKAAQRIAKKAKENLRLGAMSTRRHGTRGVPLDEGIGIAKAGEGWVVYSQPVPNGLGGMKMPAAVEFGRGPIAPVSAKALYFYQMGEFRMKAGPTSPIPYFRSAIADATKDTMEEVQKGMRGLLG